MKTEHTVLLNLQTPHLSARDESIDFIRKNDPFYRYVNFVRYTDEELNSLHQRTEKRLVKPALLRF